MMRFANGFCGFGTGFMGGGLGMIILFVIAAIVIYMVFRDKNTGRWSRNENYAAVEILNERFARGDINEEEYKQKKTLLKH